VPGVLRQLQEGLLGDIRRPIDIRQDPQRRPVHQPGMAPDDLSERLGIAAAGEPLEQNCFALRRNRLSRPLHRGLQRPHL